MGVPTPPRSEATGIAMTSAVRSVLPSGISRKTGAMMASIIAVVAVLLMSMERKAVIIMNPRTTLWLLVPKGLRSTLARLRSKPVLVAATARQKPPMKSMMTGSAKLAISPL